MWVCEEEKEDKLQRCGERQDGFLFASRWQDTSACELRRAWLKGLQNKQGSPSPGGDACPNTSWDVVSCIAFPVAVTRRVNLFRMIAD